MELNAPVWSLRAGGDINPSRFVKFTGEYTIGQAAASTDQPIGISQEGAKAAPVPGASTLAAASGDYLFAYGESQICYLECGTTITAGQRLASDGDGKGVPAATGDWYGAVAEQDGSSGLIRVQVLIGQLN